MIVKKYKGTTEAEAIIAAKNDLGANAVVLNVKQMKQRGLAKLFKKDYVEITAALEEKEFDQKTQARKNPVPSSETNRGAQDGRNGLSVDLRADDAATEAVARGSERPGGNSRILTASGTGNANNANNANNAIEKKLDSLHDMLASQMGKEDLGKKEDGAEQTEEDGKTNNLNFKSLKLIYKKLIENETDEKYANSIINDIESSLKKESNLDSILSSVYQKIILKLGEPKTIDIGNRQKIIFFIGPTGVGKTTTIAKLASDLKLNQGKSLALMTADTYRIAAVEQLNTYASILDVPVDVIYTPSEMEEHVNGLSNYDVIMIDTAGRSHKNEEQRLEVIEMVENVRNMDADLDIEVYLVLSITTKYKDLLEIADAYKEIADIRLLFTKLDETSTFGNILNLRLHTNAPLSYTTSGQNVPDDIETVDVQKLAKKLLGGE